MARIFLIGYMGSGKTTLGRKLASRLNYDFIDLDHALEEQAGMTIAEYFSSFGETAFRVAESEILRQTAYPENVIISTGGGAPCFFDNMDWMNANGTTLYIKLSPKTLADRLEHGKEARPILRDKHGDELVAFIAEKLTEREPFYTRAKVIIDGLGLTADKAAQVLGL
ncbi:shikimate kinase [Mucilaginibacter daejeonensis]|uniref:shikimate kinase n=1 Tax=Mucilaginibacter daejeonensis TaxID=398049 RepID=UPI001D179042|nr:shikimate kinase [Mucilaginibacter daejeonensis]UEG53147.1 shikimate kinase [Mucilaginibacter daejeonensis]